MHYSSVSLAVVACVALNVSASETLVAADGALMQSVHYGDLDLRKPEGVEVLLKRVRRAAQDVCSPLAAKHSWARHSKCVGRAVANAITEVDNAALTTRYLAVASAQRKRTERWNSAGVRP